ncbi:hypothetical protein [Kutzneria kofuensis]|uniref:Multisubunit Na+/H+ antiporter MnhG subunit n=1 Tax=Kutzneria kofuensis TaxID=103725 RepID=A0A7W9NLH9_9PSEU|nr:hypothetical protein [Kutzneria kofuensis]MBB5896481.1 multisubunit Na+/H+ antiporter MnhG subunit [Kutzneria kofuensis]
MVQARNIALGLLFALLATPVAAQALGAAHAHAEAAVSTSVSAPTTGGEDGGEWPPR